MAVDPLSDYAFEGVVGLPMPSISVKIIDSLGQPCPINTPGELCVKGPQVMRGYWQKPKETQAVMLEGAWFKTGDIASMDARGFLRIVDRKKDMINVSGFNVYPNEVESVIADMPEIAEVAVIGLPDSKQGERVVAFAVKKSAITAADIQVFCRKALTGYKIPKEVKFKTELLKTPVGKISRKALRDAAILKQD